MHKLSGQVHASHKILSIANEGRTFVCGDLHGCFDQLTHEMSLVQFNKKLDQLIVLGDMTDRGIKNYECLKLLAEPWCKSVLGNHDEMMINAVDPRSDRHFWRANGGGWFDLLSHNQQEEIRALCDQYVEYLPLSMTLVLPDGAAIGLLHADAPNDWFDAVQGTQQRMQALWGRSRIRDQDCTTVSNIDLVLVGHTSNSNIVQLGNVVYLDTGAGFINGHLTMIEIGQSLSDLKRNIDRKARENQRNGCPDIIFEPLGEYEVG